MIHSIDMFGIIMSCDLGLEVMADLSTIKPLGLDVIVISIPDDCDLDKGSVGFSGRGVSKLFVHVIVQFYKDII